jgi:hypothetical protein
LRTDAAEFMVLVPHFGNAGCVVCVVIGHCNGAAV